VKAGHGRAKGVRSSNICATARKNAMGSFSLTHWLVVILVIMLLFGRGRISDLMGDFAKGINSFKKGLNDSEPPPPQVTNAAQTGAPAPPASAPVTTDDRAR
jgi:sec-independent protein translocase protein TatA